MRKRAVFVAVALVALALGLVFGVAKPFSQSKALQGHALRLELISNRNHEEEGDAKDARPTVAARPGVKFTAPRPVVQGKLGSSVGNPITFGQPTISGVQGNGFEQDLRLDLKNNLVYTSAPGALSSDTSWIWQSKDSGKTFKWIPAAAPQTGKAIACAGGGDTELDVSNGKLYFNDLTVANFSIARSDDQGRTIPCNNSGVPDSGVDRQWYAHTPCCDPTQNGWLYLVNDEIGPGAPQCGNSTGNNVLVMYRSPTPQAGAAAAGLQFGAANKVSGINTCNEGIMGNDEVSPVATRTGLNGQPNVLNRPYFHIYVVHDDATFSKILIGRCRPVPFTEDPSGVKCVDAQIANLGDPSTVRTGGNFPTLAIDKAGNLYAVWEQAPVSGGHVGNSSLMYAYSTDEGIHWSAPIQIPTPGLLNNVFAWAAAGNDGHVDIAWYGTSAAVNPSNPNCADGPDSVNGLWGLYVTQTLNGHDAVPTFAPPVLASEHYIHKGNIQTVMGGQCGDRTLGDFLQIRVGAAGQAEVSYSDSNNVAEVFAPHGMYVRQSGGPSVYSGNVPTITPPVGSTPDVPGDGIYSQAGVDSPNMPNLDIVGSSLAVPSPAACHPAGTACLRVRMRVANLTPTPPVPPDTDTTEIWQTQWLVPAAASCTTGTACANGGRNPMVYAESTGGGAFTCWSGENSAQAIGGGVTLTYPGTTQITAPGACDVVTGPNGTITIDVPLTDALLQGVPTLDNTLYSVTATTLTAPSPPDSVPPTPAGLGGVYFNLIDAAPAYNLPLAGAPIEPTG
jgi:hypothetical protein